MGLNWMSQWLTFDDAVAVVTPDPFSLDESFILQLLDDPLNGPLGYADLNGNFSKHLFRV